MSDIITNTMITVRSIKTGATYEAQYTVERPAGEFGMVRASLLIFNEFGTFLDSYKPTVLEAIDGLREQIAGHWKRA